MHIAQDELFEADKLLLVWVQFHHVIIYISTVMTHVGVPVNLYLPF